MKIRVARATAKVLHPKLDCSDSSWGCVLVGANTGAGTLVDCSRDEAVWIQRVKLGDKTIFSNRVYR